MTPKRASIMMVIPILFFIALLFNRVSVMASNSHPEGVSASDWQSITNQLNRVGAVPSQQAYLKADNSEDGDYFGESVAIDGNTIVVGAYLEASDSNVIDSGSGNNSAPGAGAVFVFVKDGSNWIKQAYLKADNSADSDHFGISVAIDGDTIVVGAIGEDSDSDVIDSGSGTNGAPNAGAAYVFVRSGVTWSQQAYLKADNSDDGDNFGRSVAVDGDTVIVGAPFESSGSDTIDSGKGDNTVQFAGAAYVFVRSGVTWSQQAYLKADNSEELDYFGYSVDVDAETAVVGAYNEDSDSDIINSGKGDNNARNSGAVYVFVRSGTTWSLQSYLKADNSDQNDKLGFSVGIDGDTIVAGAYREESGSDTIDSGKTDNTVDNAGAAYIFIRSGMTWSQQAYLKADNSDEGDQFGFAVAIDGDNVIVGAVSEDSDSNVIDSGKADGTAPGAGAAYVFSRDGTTWTLETYLKADNSDDDDQFGYAVGIAGDLMIAGARWEDSDSNTINSGSADNTGDNQGAGYLFECTCLAQTTPTTTIYTYIPRVVR